MGPLKSHYTPLYVHLHKMHSCWYYHEHFTWLLSKSIRLYRAALETQDACGMPMLCQYALPLIPQGEALIQCPYPWPDLITEHYLISFCSVIKWTIKSQIKCKLDYIQATPPPTKVSNQTHDDYRLRTLCSDFALLTFAHQPLCHVYRSAPKRMQTYSAVKKFLHRPWFLRFLAYLSHLHVSHHQTMLMIDQNNLSKYKTCFLNNNFII